jgi:general secretion pathway protein K
VRRTSNLIALDQADVYLRMAEEWSQQILRKDREDSSIDELGEDWAVELPPIPVTGGYIQGRLTDLHSCLNINSLLEAGSINTTTQNRLTQLFTNLGYNKASYQVIEDWIDNDLDTANPNGAEDGYYLNTENPYRTANRPLHSITELRLIKGFEESKQYESLKKHLCAFVASGSVAINVNTASDEVLKSLSPGMTDKLVQDIISHRNDTPFNDLKDFTSFAKLGTIIKDTAKLTVSSEYFLLRTQAVIGQANKVMYSIIYRDSAGKTGVISRSYRTL